MKRGIDGSIFAGGREQPREIHTPAASVPGVFFWDDYFAKRDEDYMRWILADEDERRRIAEEYGE